MNATGIAERVRTSFPDVVVARDEASVIVGRAELLGALGSFRDDPELGLDFLSSVTANDRPGRDPRFWVVYELASTDHHHRLRVKVGVSEDDPHVPSVTGVFPTADWYERETYDFFGIVYEGHHALTRIMMPDDWIGHPQRKDYPLGGIPVEYKGATIPPPDQRRSYN